MSRFAPAKILHDNPIINYTSQNFKSGFGVTYTEFKTCNAQQVLKRPTSQLTTLNPMDEPEEEDFPYLNKTLSTIPLPDIKEAVLTLKGPDYRQKLVQSGS